MEFDSSGCTNSWAEMRGGTYVFACKGCMEVARSVGEGEDLRQMMETMKRFVTGLGLEENRRHTGVGKEEKEKCEGVLTPGRSDDTLAEDLDTDVEIEGEHGTGGDTSGRRMDVKICYGAPILATN